MSRAAKAAVVAVAGVAAGLSLAFLVRRREKRRAEEGVDRSTVLEDFDKSAALDWGQKLINEVELCLKGGSLDSSALDLETLAAFAYAALKQDIRLAEELLGTCAPSLSFSARMLAAYEWLALHSKSARECRASAEERLRYFVGRCGPHIGLVEPVAHKSDEEAREWLLSTSFRVLDHLLGRRLTLAELHHEHIPYTSHLCQLLLHDLCLYAPFFERLLYAECKWCDEKHVLGHQLWYATLIESEAVNTSDVIRRLLLPCAQGRVGALGMTPEELFGLLKDRAVQLNQGDSFLLFAGRNCAFYGPAVASHFKEAGLAIGIAAPFLDETLQSGLAAFERRQEAHREALAARLAEASGSGCATRSLPLDLCRIVAAYDLFY